MPTHFERFANAVASAGLRAADRGRGHWQIMGGSLLVNYYKKKSRIYIAGTVTGFVGTIQDAIDATRKPPEICAPHKRDRRNKRDVRSIKTQLLRRRSRCRWWNKKLTYKTATIEHVIPLARGGLDQPNNRDLACLKCNTSRGHDMPELQAGNVEGK